MKNILHVSNPNVYARFVGAPQLHPLVSVIHYDEVSPVRTSLNRYGVYGLFIQKNFPRNLTYGMKMFDAADASIIAVEPGQIGGKEDSGEDLHISGWVLLFSPELLHGTDLEAKIKDYPYFSYFATETLIMEPSEWGRITQLLTQLRYELQENEDSPALRAVILGYIRLVLEYCQRIYQRQLSQEDKTSSDILKRYHNLRPHRPVLRGAACLFAPLPGRRDSQIHRRYRHRLHPLLCDRAGQEPSDERS